MASWKRDFASGLIVLVPLLVTAIFLAWIYTRLASVPIPVDTEPIRVLITIVIFVLLAFSVGYLMRTAVGSVLERAIDDAMNQLPGLRVIYNASKMAVETALSGPEELQTPVRLEVWDGLRMTAFKTGKTTPDGRDVLFLPTSPNITTGYVIEVEPDRYTESDEAVEDALTRVLSAGFGDSDDRRKNESIRELFNDDETPEETPVSGAVEAAEAKAGGDGEAATEPGTTQSGTAGGDAEAAPSGGSSTDPSPSSGGEGGPKGPGTDAETGGGDPSGAN
jgi:uncharacterized membrane protein